MAMTTHAVGSAYVRVALEAATDVTVQATGTAGLRVAPGTDAEAPAANVAGFLIVYGNAATRAEIPGGAIWAKSALENRASEATVEAV